MAFADLLAQIGARVIHLGRRNSVKHAVSFFTGQRLWEETGAWNIYGGQRGTTELLQLDEAEFDRQLRQIEKEAARLADYVLRLELPTLTLYYEDLVMSPEEWLPLVLAYLGLPPCPTTGRTSKNTSDDLRAVIANFDDLRACYVGTRYAAMFDEGRPATAAPGVAVSPGVRTGQRADR